MSEMSLRVNLTNPTIGGASTQSSPKRKIGDLKEGKDIDEHSNGGQVSTASEINSMQSQIFITSNAQHGDQTIVAKFSDRRYREDFITRYGTPSFEVLPHQSGSLAPEAIQIQMSDIRKKSDGSYLREDIGEICYADYSKFHFIHFERFIEFMNDKLSEMYHVIDELNQIGVFNFPEMGGRESKVETDFCARVERKSTYIKKLNQGYIEITEILLNALELDNSEFFDASVLDNEFSLEPKLKEVFETFLTSTNEDNEYTGSELKAAFKEFLATWIQSIRIAVKTLGFPIKNSNGITQREAGFNLSAILKSNPPKGKEDMDWIFEHIDPSIEAVILGDEFRKHFLRTSEGINDIEKYTEAFKSWTYAGIDYISENIVYLKDNEYEGNEKHIKFRGFCSASHVQFHYIMSQIKGIIELRFNEFNQQSEALFNERDMELRHTVINHLVFSPQDAQRQVESAIQIAGQAILNVVSDHIKDGLILDSWYANAIKAILPSEHYLVPKTYIDELNNTILDMDNEGKLLESGEKGSVQTELKGRIKTALQKRLTQDAEDKHREQVSAGQQPKLKYTWNWDDIQAKYN
ncbi:MAG: hypothetical protein VW397_06190 [Candidatus Margulisiibacteriota bacterium]